MNHHIVIIGGTGMLARASIVLADRCDHLTMVARTKRSLKEVESSLRETQCVVNTLRLD